MVETAAAVVTGATGTDEAADAVAGTTGTDNPENPKNPEPIELTDDVLAKAQEQAAAIERELKAINQYIEETREHLKSAHLTSKADSRDFMLRILDIQRRIVALL